MWKYPQENKDIHKKLWISTSEKVINIGINSIIHRAVDNFVDNHVISIITVKKPVN